MLAWPEMVVCSHSWAGDARSSSEHFSESFFPPPFNFTASKQIFNGWLSDAHRRLTYHFQRQMQCLAGTANRFPICKWTFGHCLLQEDIQRFFASSTMWDEIKVKSLEDVVEKACLSLHTFRNIRGTLQNAKSRVSAKPLWSHLSTADETPLSELI